MATTLKTYWGIIKEKKQLLVGTHVFGLYAHSPSRMTKITLSGGYSLTIDRRLEYTSPANGTMATLEVINFNVNDAFDLVRLWDKEQLGKYREVGIGGNGFYLQHAPEKPWSFWFLNNRALVENYYAGTSLQTIYTWNSTSQTWVAGATTSGNVWGLFALNNIFSGTIGGYAPGDTNALNRFSMEIRLGDIVCYPQVYRYAWEQPMASDNSFQQAFQDYIDYVNTFIYGANVASGSSNVMVNFVF